jgi:hypothetical protein
VSDLPLQDESSSRRFELIAIACALAIFCAASFACAILSDGFLEADSVTHYLYARFAVTERHFLVNIWGRPLVTWLYSYPAYIFGRMGVRLTSLLLALTCAFVAYAIARGQKYRWASLALIFTLAQPLVFLHSFSELTELPFAALIGLAFLAYQRRQFLVMTILVALSPLARPEGFGFLVLAMIALIAHRRWWWIPLLVVPLLWWDYQGWLEYGSPRYQTGLPGWLQWALWLKHEWPYAQETLYNRGSIFHFLMLMPAVASPLIFPATCVGAWWFARSARQLRSRPLDHRAVCDVLILLIPLFILAGHSILYATGKMASSGEMRYMLVVAPFWGLLGARGWQWLAERLNWKHPLLWASVISIAPAMINVRIYIAGETIGYHILPLHLNNDMIIARRVARLYKTWPTREEYPRVLAAHPGVCYFLDISPTGKLQTREWKRSTIEDAPRGTILIWDPIYGVYNSDAARSVPESAIEDAGWVYDEIGSELINDPDAPDNERWSVWFSPENWEGAATDPAVTSLAPVPLQ